MPRLHVALLIAVAAVAGCKKNKDAKTEERVSPPPPAVDAATATATASGSATGSGSGSATGSGSASGSGSAAAAPSTKITADGVGPITKLTQGDVDDEAEQKYLADAVAPLGLTVSFEVMDMPGEVEHEEGYWSVKKGDTEVLQIFRGNDADPELSIHVIDPMFTTATGDHVGSDIGMVNGDHKDLKCVVDHDSELGLITCTAPSAPKLTYVVDAQKFKGKTFDAYKDPTRKVVVIVR